MTDLVGIVALFALVLIICGVAYTVISDIRRTQGAFGCFTWGVFAVCMIALARYLGILKASMP